MNNLNDALFLQFDFKSTSGAAEAPLIFTQPVQVISTYDFDEVATCLKEIDEKVAKGYYAAGYCSYEMTYALQDAAPDTQQHSKMPLLWFGIFNKPASPPAAKMKNKTYSVGKWQPKITKSAYEDAFSNIMEAIKQKETSQINYTIPFEASFSGDSYRFYKHLRNAQQSNYCAYLNMGGPHTILSASPELFFQVQQKKITVRPMKGTAKRGKSSKEDQQQKQALQQSTKNKLENQLITKVMKKELEKVASKSSIQVVDRYRIEQYPTVYQLTTGIQGTLKNKTRFSDILTALFPCGSIAGDPKQASISIIRQEEKYPREVYCGAIGYITPNQEAIFNVPIRTVWLNSQTNKANYGAGGAITENSNSQEEYEEVLTKTNILHWDYPAFKLLETIRLEEGKIFLLEKHLERLQASADYFSIPVDVAAIRKALIQTGNRYPKGVWRLRLTIDSGMKPNISIHQLTETNLHKVELAKQPIDMDNMFHYHKTTYRELYRPYKTDNPAHLDTLLWNKRNELTEFTIGNVVVELKGKLFTPPVSSGLLPGTYREQLLEDNIIQKRNIFKEDLASCERIWLINSLRQWTEVQLETKL